METTSLALDEIVVGDRLRGLNQQTVETLKESITKLGGIKTPISVRFISNEEGWQLVAGRHRLQAAIELAMPRIPVREETGSELDARLWEIAENLHRADLTALQRDEHIAAWDRLSAEKAALSGEISPPLSIKATAKALHLDRKDVREAIRVAALPQEVKEEATRLGLDRSHAALAAVTGDAFSKEDQIRALREKAVQKAASRDVATASERRIEAAVDKVQKLSQEELSVFADWFRAYVEDGGSVFDRTAAGERLAS